MAVFFGSYAFDRKNGHTVLLRLFFNNMSKKNHGHTGKHGQIWEFDRKQKQPYGVPGWYDAAKRGIGMYHGNPCFFKKHHLTEVGIWRLRG